MFDLSEDVIGASVFAEYQPIIDLGDNRIVGCEALARWRLADGTTSSIETVVDAIESDEDRATALTARMLRCVRDDLGDVLEKHPRFSVSINIPPIVLGRGRVRKVIEDLGLIHRIDQITGEITERQALDDLGRSAIRLARDLGAHIAIDDFGTGNSGLQQLIGLEVDALKIDRSFIIRLGEDRAAERLVRAIVALATVLDVGLVAEGVETAEQAVFLRAIGVDKGQGWLWSRAVRPADLKSAITKA